MVVDGRGGSGHRGGAKVLIVGIIAVGGWAHY